jgi:hypothetical protein
MEVKSGQSQLTGLSGHHEPNTDLNWPYPRPMAVMVAIGSIALNRTRWIPLVQSRTE